MEVYPAISRSPIAVWDHITRRRSIVNPRVDSCFPPSINRPSQWGFVTPSTHIPPIAMGVHAIDQSPIAMGIRNAVDQHTAHRHGGSSHRNNRPSQWGFIYHAVAQSPIAMGIHNAVDQYTAHRHGGSRHRTIVHRSG